MSDIVTHPLPPIFDENSRILILGSFPSVKSREGEFYYHHPQNRFWKVISAVYGEKLPITIAEKKQLLLCHGVAVWDVIESCEITGSSDSSIREVSPTDLSIILETANISRIIANGETAYKLYMKYIYPVTGMDIAKLPSTSPANAAYSLEKLIDCWNYLKTT